MPARVAFVIMLIAASLWVSEAVPLFVTSFVVLILSLTWLSNAIEESGGQVSSVVFLSPFFSDIILLFLGGFILSAALHKYRLDEQVARWIIRRSGGSLPRLMFGVMVITAFLSMWLSNTATAAMMLSLLLPVLQSMPADSRARKGLILSVPFAANAGGLGTPIGSPPNAIAMKYMQQLGIDPSFGMWMLGAVPFVVLMILAAWALIKVLFKVSGSLEYSAGDEAKLKLSLGSIVVLAGTGVTVAGWLTGGLHGLSSGTISLIPLIVFFGTGILNTRDLKNISWDVLLVMGGGLCLGAAMAESGLASWVVGRLPSDKLGLYGVMLSFGILACVMSSLMSNTATANLVMPIALGLTLAPLSPVLLVIAFSCSLAMALPISTPPNAMAFSSGEIRVADMLIPGLILTATGLALTFTLGYWWWDLVGIF